MLSIRRWNEVWILPVLAAASLFAGCGSDDDDKEEVVIPAPQRACMDLADAIAGSAQRCGFDYQANYDAFVEAAAGGDCAKIIAVRDIDALYDECVPFMKGLTCEEIDDPMLAFPAGCQQQLGQ